MTTADAFERAIEYAPNAFDEEPQEHNLAVKVAERLSQRTKLSGVHNYVNRQKNLPTDTC